MFRGAAFSTPDLLQLLIDAGGSVNGESGREPPLFWTVFNSREDNGRVLLAQPAFDFYLQYEGRAPEQFARNRGESALADAIVQEVSRGLPTAPTTSSAIVAAAVVVVTIRHRLCIIVVTEHSQHANPCRNRK